MGRAGIALMYLHMAKALTRAQASAVSTSSAWGSGQVSSAAMSPLHEEVWQAQSQHGLLMLAQASSTQPAGGTIQADCVCAMGAGRPAQAVATAVQQLAALCREGVRLLLRCTLLAGPSPF